MGDYKLSYCGNPEGNGHESIACGEFYYGSTHQCRECGKKDIAALIAENDLHKRFIDEYSKSLGQLQSKYEMSKAENEALKQEVKELHRKIGGSATHPDKGHGHVFPRSDGIRMRCGGPGMCAECRADKARKDSGQ